MSLFSALNRIRGHSVWTGQLEPESVVVDAGAHRGEFSSSLHSLFGCRCILIEANPRLASELAVPPGGQVIHAALSGTDGRADFVFRDNPEGGSITSSPDDGGNETATVDRISLATLMKIANAQQIDLLKLDIEGAEFELLEMTDETLLSNIKQITVEFHDFLPQYATGKKYETVRKRMENLGFVCCAMSFRTHGDVLFLNKRWFNGDALNFPLISHLGRWVLKGREWISRQR